MFQASGGAHLVASALQRGGDHEPQRASAHHHVKVQRLERGRAGGRDRHHGGALALGLVLGVAQRLCARCVCQGECAQTSALSSSSLVRAPHGVCGLGATGQQERERTSQ